MDELPYTLYQQLRETLPEPPGVEAGAEAQVEVGMVLVLHPAVRVPGVGGAFIGETVLITEDGPLPIHNIPEYER